MTVTRDTNAAPRILVVDDDPGARESLEAILEDDYLVYSAADGQAGLSMLDRHAIDMVLLDLTMPDMDGIAVLEQIRERDRAIEVIMVSATDRAREAAAAIKSGACDYVTKPYDADRLLALIERVLQRRAMEKELRFLRAEVAQKSAPDCIISNAESMRPIFAVIDKVAGTRSNVLITGESGTGKELIARAIHLKSPRAAKPFVAINCAAIPDELIESELFGHEKGAFTGAAQRGTGKFEFADGGTLFLDEISALKIELQAKLLRFLQEREFTRVGSNRAVKVDVRVVAATNTQLLHLVHGGRFREDLYFRLNVIPIDVPPLRRRRGDVPLLARYFLSKITQALNKRIPDISPAAMAVMEGYPWPGNVRELENLIERMVVLGAEGATIDERDLPYDLFFHRRDAPRQDTEGLDGGLMAARRAFERQCIERALRKSGWNQTEAANLLKIHRNTLINKIRTLNIRCEAPLTRET